MLACIKGNDFINQNKTYFAIGLSSAKTYRRYEAKYWK